MRNTGLSGQWSVISGFMIAAVWLAAAPTQAGWLQAGAGPYVYTNAANWTGGIIDGTWPAALTLTTNQNIHFNASGTLGPMRILHNPSVSGFELLLTATNADRTLHLAGDILADTTANKNTLAGIAFGSATVGRKLNLTLNGHRTITCYGGGTYDGRGLFIENQVSAGTFPGSTLTVAGGSGWINNAPENIARAGGVIFDGAHTYTGRFTVAKRTFVRFAGQGVLGTTDVLLEPGATLELNNRANNAFNGFSQQSLPSRIANAATIVMHSAQFRHYIHFNTGVTEAVDRVVLRTGLSRLKIANAGIGGETTAYTVDSVVALTHLERSTGSTLWLRGEGVNEVLYTIANLGQTTALSDNRLTVVNPPTLMSGMIPWALVEHDIDPSVTAASRWDFATYGANGFTHLTGHVTDLNAAGPADNVLVETAQVLTAPAKTVNSLTLRSPVGTAVPLGGTGVLSIASGALLYDFAAGGSIETPASLILDFNGQDAILVRNNGVGWNVNGVLTNAASMTFTGPAAATGSENPIYLRTATGCSGPLYINAGFVAAAHAQAISPASAVRVDLGGVLSLYGFNTTMASLEGHGAVQFTYVGSGSTANTLTVGGNHSNAVFHGVLRPGSTVSTATGGNVVKVGTGSWTLTATNHTYSGVTTVSNGVLLVNGALPPSAGTVVVAGGALGGTGRVARAVTVQNGGSLSPGDGGPGTLTVSNLVLQAGARLRYDLGPVGVTGGGTNDLLVVRGNVTLDGFVDVVGHAGLGRPGTYRLMTVTGSITDNGMDLGTVQGASISGARVVAGAGYVDLQVPPRGTVVAVQ